MLYSIIFFVLGVSILSTEGSTNVDYYDINQDGCKCIGSWVFWVWIAEIVAAMLSIFIIIGIVKNVYAMEHAKKVAPLNERKKEEPVYEDLGPFNAEPKYESIQESTKDAEYVELNYCEMRCLPLKSD